MCMNDGCDWIDEPLCSLKIKALCFGVWSLFIAAVVLVLGGLFCMAYGFLNIVTAPTVAFGFVHLIGGIALLLGLGINSPNIFLTGIFGTSALPYVVFPLFFCPIIQILFTIAACRYYTQEMIFEGERPPKKEKKEDKHRHKHKPRHRHEDDD